MADTKISALTSGNPAQSGDELPINRAGANFKITAGSIAALAAVMDGDKGDITVSGSGATWTVDNGAIGTAKLGGDITTAGKALLDDATAADQRTTLGLGSLATQSGTFSGTSSGTNTGDQTITLTGDVTGTGTGSFAATIAAGAVGTSKLGGDITTAGKALLDDADASAQRTTLGLGTAATSNTGDFAAASHNHAASAITSGTIDTARLASGTANSGTFLRGDQTWAAVPATTAAGSDTQVQFNDGGTSFGGDSGLTYNKTTDTLSTKIVALGTAGSALGQVTLAGSTSGVVTVQPAAAAGTWSLTLPTTAGTNGQALTTNGSGVASWSTIAATPAGNSGQLQYNNGGAFAGSLLTQGTNLIEQVNGTNSQVLNIYRTYTDGSNYERLAVSAGTYSTATFFKLLPETAGTGADHIGLVIGPVGNGAITTVTPDGTSAGGNVRGTKAVDLCLSRTTATQVASGQESFAAGYATTASGERSVALGHAGNASGKDAVAFGRVASASGQESLAAGSNCSATGTNCAAVGFASSANGYNTAIGYTARAYIVGQVSFGSTSTGQASLITYQVNTTDATTTEAPLVGIAGNRAVVPANTTWCAEVDVVARKSGGADNACFKRRVMIKRDGSNNTALIGTVETIGTDIGSNAGVPPAGWAVTLTADDTNEALKLEVTGAASTNIRWFACARIIEATYA